MKKDDIIAMARLAGYQHPDAVGQCEDFAYFDLERFAALVAAKEREACAQVCEERTGVDASPIKNFRWFDCAAAIRARGAA